MFRAIYGAIPPPLPYLGQRAFQALFQHQVVQEFVATMQEGEFLRPGELSGLPVPAALVWGLAYRLADSGAETIVLFDTLWPLPQRIRYTTALKRGVWSGDDWRRERYQAGE